MFIDSSFHQFTDDEIDKAPILDGVYGLYDRSDVIYFGKGEGENGIRNRLERHKAGYEGTCTQKATSFNYETCFNPSQREAELLNEYKKLYGKLPRCNDITPSYSNF